MRTALDVEVLVQQIAPIAWRSRAFKCKVGFHDYGDISDEDIASGSRYCKRCGRIDRFTGVALAECIRRRSFMMIREYAHDGTPPHFSAPLTAASASSKA